MSSVFRNEKAVSAALVLLIVLQTVMFLSLLAGIAPHPPRVIPIAGMGPLIAAGIGLASAAIVMRNDEGRARTVLSLLAAAVALLSFGPQKWWDPAIGETWPAVLLGQAAALIIILGALAPAKQERNP